MSGSSLRDRYAGTISTARRSRGPTRGRRALFESLEPRLLLSADPVLVLAPPAQQDSIAPVIISASDLVAGPGQAASVVIRTEQVDRGDGFGEQPLGRREVAVIERRLGLRDGADDRR